MERLTLFTPQTLTISELTYYLRQLFESDEILNNIWVQGEISNLSMPSSGHVYFTLKDNSAQLRSVIWRSAAAKLKPLLRNGALVEAHGAIGIYPDQGSYQLYIDALRPAGEGRLYQEFIRLKARLEAEGLFEPQRKRPLPTLPQCIGIVTSPTGAALQDMLNTLRKRYPLARVILSPTSVQGEEAPAEIVAALRRLNERFHPDVILLGRGGGSMEDLWAFNDEQVVRAIVASGAPVVSGIGHETDFTLADFAADLRAPTPTGAALAATPDKAELYQVLQGTAGQLADAMQFALQTRQRQLESLGARLKLASPLWQVQNGRQRLDETFGQLQRVMQHTLQYRRLGCQGMSQRLEALNPLAVLKRGFAIVSLADGQVASSVEQIKNGDSLTIRLADGQLAACAGDRKAEKPEIMSINPEKR